MVKKRKIITYIIMAIFAFNIFTTVAQALNISDGIILLEAEPSCEAILGDPNDDESTIYLMQQIFDVMKFLTPLLVLGFTIIDYAKAVASQDKDMVAKATKRTIVRFIVGLVIFVVPTALDFALKILGWTGTCGIN